MPRERAVILVQSWLDELRQEKLLLPYCAERRLQVTSITGDPEAALALVQAGLVQVVVTVLETRGMVELGGEVHEAGGRLEAIRRMATPESRHGNAVRAAIARGASPETVALVLGIDVRVVHEVLGQPMARPQDRRPAVAR